ncbi:phosphatidylinositol 4-phosphate 5-kinase 8-like isoform X1 [Quercus robur]|uniref:phosphatidylinositol 4-phosphate 5-kinase 8-like isoform X1 n=1 Tax=Quercus robur TaxID=38942 RepID=UPI0021613763|nr:phosphatidylinositol 4-phosphate 5-kinase 8-like isoform X1 [Quercus robur]XP_050262950.1 phosphatidylinositol 4-phosphate 5-kinase 8-like isoform X1 [Quercus robur]XP_050262951.1 phosphatidylinositol 4-phosphate 5-kinase 8-like isoform X1 [Quercus robur]XP_050262952.1 phosphatidylinositol 4-phosphate 5-kinase 8-like isoform X1 [Quercus robur]
MDDIERLSEKAFPNGDIYSGDFKALLPNGKGKYTWSDGTIYEGDWKEGKMTGKGQIIWSKGAKYEGDFSGGYLHGFGTFTIPEGSFYSGDWRMNVQHGFGRKQYSNFDTYEGSWNEGVHEGSGRYRWCDGNTYRGHWKAGIMSGRGVMKWVNGDLFDGLWLNGFRHGSGTYRFADGGYYIGTWSRDLKDGKGTFYPAGSKHPTLNTWSRSLGYDDGKNFLSHNFSLNSEEGRAPTQSVKCSLSEKISIGGILKNTGRKSHNSSLLDKNQNLCDPARDFTCHESSGMSSHTSDEGQHEVHDNNTLVYEREYLQGILIKERVRKYAELTCKTKQRKTFNVKKAIRSSCLDIFKGNQSYYLMLNLQLGIRYTVGKITPVPMREVRYSDFGDRARIRMYFPRKGSQFTPPHYSIDFHWKDYCPMVFRNLREMFKLDAAEYMMSMCGDDGLRELASPGKSGSIFYLSHDDRFVIKTLKRSELKVLLKMLPKYYEHVKKHENTLITKFFGLHRITLRGGRKVRFVVMGNMFCTELRVHRRYDLKGSSIGRVTNEDKIDQTTTLKDLDLLYEFHMDKLLREYLLRQIHLDCEFLESQQIIDYSLLLGVHLRAPEQKTLLETGDDAISQGELMIPPTRLVLVNHEPNILSKTPGPHSRGNVLRAYSLGDKEVDLLLPGTGRFRVQLGVNMPAQAHPKPDSKVEPFEVYDVVLFMGIIDILQEYNVKKKLEHACKSLRYDPLKISVVEPKLYAKRFNDFLKTVFPDLP